MTFTLASVVPWGRSFDEYRAMFALDDADLAGPVLGCADGPASFNAGAAERGARVVSCDPLYRCGAAEIEERIAATRGTVLRQLHENRGEFVWRTFRSPEEVGEVRLAAMRRFLADYPTGGRAGRYVAAALPALPFRAGAFALALCSHFLFLYSGHHDLGFHLASVRELGRVAGEVRIFPLVGLSGGASPRLAPLAATLRGEGWAVSRQRVGYEFQRGADEMLRLVPPHG